MPGYERGIPSVLRGISKGENGEFLWDGKEISGTGGGGELEQGVGYSDVTYLYVAYGVDGNWIVIRDTRSLIERTSTGIMDGDKPITLEEIQLLTYN